MISDYRGDENIKVFRADSCTISLDKILLRCGREGLDCDKELGRRIESELNGACMRLLRQARRELSDLSHPVFIEINDKALKSGKCIAFHDSEYSTFLVLEGAVEAAR